MNFETAGYQLAPVMPEIVLALGAMVLLMLGAYRAHGATLLVTGLAACLLIVVGFLVLTLPAMVSDVNTSLPAWARSCFAFARSVT